jgi:hypothetical protein
MVGRPPITFAAAFTRLIEATANHAKNPDPSDLALLDRWKNDPRAERVWQRIYRFVPAFSIIDPLAAITLLVLLAKRSAENLPNPKAIKERKKRLSTLYLLRARSLEDLATAWRELGAGNHFRSKMAIEKAETYERDACGWRKAAQFKSKKQRHFLVSRIDKSGSRKQRFFMQAVGESLRKLCGRPMDSETAILNDIAFDTEEATTVFQARSARRSSTRAGRQSL